MRDKSLQDIENEMKDLRPEKELAYIDYAENAGNSWLRDQLWNRFESLQNDWNNLVKLREKLLK